MMRLIFAAMLMLSAMAGAAHAMQPVRERIMQFDVIELIKGEQVEGVSKFKSNFGKFTYWFANEENLQSFLSAPEKYEIQLGGACARMGPLSGEGTPKLAAAHDGKVYIFASEACRAAFMEGPERFLTTDDAVPESTEESRKLGRRLLGKAVDAIACQAQIDGVTTYRETLARDEKHGEIDYHISNTLTLRRPDGTRWEVCWNEDCWAYVTSAGAGWAVSSDGTSEMHAQQQTELMRDAGRHPYMMLWQRDAKIITISADGTKRTINVPDEGDVEVELVTVHLHGATSMLGLDEAGRIRLLAYRGRGPNSTIGDIERIYSQFREVSGLRLPARMDSFFNGKPVAAESGVFAEQVIDDPADAAKFIRMEEGEVAVNG